MHCSCDIWLSGYGPAETTYEDCHKRITGHFTIVTEGDHCILDYYLNSTTNTPGLENPHAAVTVEIELGPGGVVYQYDSGYITDGTAFPKGEDSYYYGKNISIPFAREYIIKVKLYVSNRYYEVSGEDLEYVKFQPWLTINYYSNYANKVQDSYGNKTSVLDPHQNVFIRSDDIYRDDYYEAGLRDYSGYSSANTLIMRRNGYIPTQYWNTEPDGSGYSFPEVPSEPITGEDLADALGANDRGEINVYPQWKKQKEVYINKNGDVYASNYIEDSSVYIDSDANIHAPSFTSAYTGSEIKISQNGNFSARNLYIGTPKFPYACTI